MALLICLIFSARARRAGKKNDTTPRASIFKGASCTIAALAGIDRSLARSAAPGRRGLVIMVSIISKQRNRGLITVLCHDMSRARKSKRGDLSSRMSSRDPVIWIFDLGPSRGVTMLPICSATAVFGRLAWF
jgi:hypothetical protein